MRVLTRAHRQSSSEDNTIKKNFLLYEGSYTIDRQVGPNSYVVKSNTSEIVGKQNVINLKEYPAHQHQTV